MGKMGRQIVENADEIIELLNKALADEWLAYYQYWVGAQVVRGPMRPQLEAEMKEHAKEELEHADLLAERIVQLGGTPVLDPAEWQKIASCKYEAPTDPSTKAVVAQNIKAERCAITVYKNILEKVKLSNDPITFHIIRHILQDEVEHEEDLEAIEEDLSTR